MDKEIENRLADLEQRVQVVSEFAAMLAGQLWRQGTVTGENMSKILAGIKPLNDPSWPADDSCRTAAMSAANQLRRLHAAIDAYRDSR